MNRDDDHRGLGEQRKQAFNREVAKKELRRIKARQERDRGVWFGLGMFGLVGWAVAIPSLIGIAVGVWIDERWPSGYSWTLMGLFAGLVLGCMNAWYWVKKESGSET